MTTTLLQHALGSLLLIASVSACKSTPPIGSPAEPLIVVSNFVHPPFSSRDELGQAVGIEVELIAKAAKHLNRDVVWQERPWAELLSAVASGEADFAASTIGITSERAQTVAFSEPYFETSVIAVVTDSPDGPKTLAQLDRARVGTDPGTTGVVAVKSRLPNATLLTERTDERSWGEWLVTGDIDAVIIDASHAETFMKNAGTRFHVIEEPLAKEHFGIVMQLGATELHDAMNRVIQLSQAD
ncbi:MAG: ABC-type amino acid transport substrate-binding protein [Planctomycetota bacterium]|jgi:ABC-type amino acid transport substrate-binding protein